MYTIKEKGSQNIPVITITDYIDPNGYCPKVDFTLTYSNEGFHVHFDVYEKNPKRIYTKHFEPVNFDSCLEWFVKFDPEHSQRYINFEVNANGVINFAFRKDRYDFLTFTEEDVECLNIKAEIFEDYWTVDYTVPLTLIKKYITDYEFKKGMVLDSNVYKCGDKTEVEHYGCWKMVDRNKPDFHMPQYFGKMIIE